MSTNQDHASDGLNLIMLAVMLFLLGATLYWSASNVNSLKTRVERMETAARSAAPITVNIHVTTPKDAQKTLKALLPTLDEMRMIR